MYRPTPLDHALELFDPQTGHRIRIDAPATHRLRQRAPRSVQLALTNHGGLGRRHVAAPTATPRRAPRVGHGSQG